MNINKLILRLDSASEEELAHLNKILNQHLRVVSVIGGSVIMVMFLPLVILFLGMYIFATPTLSATLSPAQQITAKVIFLIWCVTGVILGFYIGAKVIGRNQSGYTLRQAAKDFFKPIYPRQIIEDFRKRRSNHSIDPTTPASGFRQK